MKLSLCMKPYPEVVSFTCIEVLVDEVVVMHPRSMKHSLLVVAVTVCHGAVIMDPRSIVCLYRSSMKYSLLNRMKL